MKSVLVFALTQCYSLGAPLDGPVKLNHGESEPREVTCIQLESAKDQYNCTFKITSGKFAANGQEQTSGRFTYVPRDSSDHFLVDDGFKQFIRWRNDRVTFLNRAALSFADITVVCAGTVGK